MSIRYLFSSKSFKTSRECAIPKSLTSCRCSRIILNNLRNLLIISLILGEVLAGQHGRVRMDRHTDNARKMGVN